MEQSQALTEDKARMVTTPYDDFTENQAIAIAVAEKISAFLSICGSCLIIYRILKDPDTRDVKLKTMYHRIMLVMSLNDIIGSINLFLGTWMIPRDTVHSNFIWGNVGNHTTCNVQGYLTQASVLSVTICTTFLSIYFVLFVRYNWTEFKLKKVERLMQFFVFVWYLLPALPLENDAYNPTPLFCWIQSYPFNCDITDGVDCIRGEKASTYRLFFMIVPISICLVLISISMIMLYSAVRKQELSMTKYSSRQSMQALSSRSRRVFIQAIWFIGSSCCIWVPSIAMAIASKQGHGSFVLTFTVALVVPLQGFFNAIIYTHARPNIHEFMKKFSSYIRDRASSISRRSSTLRYANIFSIISSRSSSGEGTGNIATVDLGNIKEIDDESKEETNEIKASSVSKSSDSKGGILNRSYRDLTYEQITGGITEEMLSELETP